MRIFCSTSNIPTDFVGIFNKFLLNGSKFGYYLLRREWKFGQELFPKCMREGINFFVLQLSNHFKLSYGAHLFLLLPYAYFSYYTVVVDFQWTWLLIDGHICQICSQSIVACWCGRICEKNYRWIVQGVKNTPFLIVILLVSNASQSFLNFCHIIKINCSLK